MPAEISLSELQLVRLLLDRDPRKTAQISRDANVPYHWLYKLRKGETTNPGYENTRRLTLHLCK